MYLLTINEGQLKEVKNHEKGKECVEMNIEGVSPFNVLPSRRLDHQVAVTQPPTESLYLISRYVIVIDYL